MKMFKYMDTKNRRIIKIFLKLCLGGRDLSGLSPTPGPTQDTPEVSPCP